jgi:hypothetical protein
MVDIKLADPIEGMLIAQMIVANEAALGLYRRAWLNTPDYFEAATKYMALAEGRENGGTTCRTDRPASRPGPADAACGSTRNLHFRDAETRSYRALLFFRRRLARLPAAISERAAVNA